MRSYKNNLKRGFTLVELLVVIAIIGVLATIAFVAFQSNIGTADNTKKLTDLNVIAKAMGIYYVNNKQYPLPTTKASATNYYCEAGDATDGLQATASQYIDGRADIEWGDFIYAVDNKDNAQMYILGVKGLSSDAGQLDDDLDSGSDMANSNKVAATGTTKTSAASDKWVCECGSTTDTVYCETNKPKL